MIAMTFVRFLNECVELLGLRKWPSLKQDKRYDDSLLKEMGSIEF
jgi:hypothetical protein